MRPGALVVTHYSALISNIYVGIVLFLKASEYTFLRSLKIEEQNLVQINPRPCS